MYNKYGLDAVIQLISIEILQLTGIIFSRFI